MGMPAKVQKVVQIDEWTVGIELYAGSSTWLTLCWHPERARVLRSTQRPPRGTELSPFGQELRRHLIPGALLSWAQVGQDRITHLEFEGPEESFTLIAELMGKHSNVMLVRSNGHLAAAAKWLGAGKTKRPILPGRSYLPPPLSPRPSILGAASMDEAADCEGVSPFLRKWMEAGGLPAVQAAFGASRFAPSGTGAAAYPLDLSRLLAGARPLPGFSDEAEAVFSKLATQDLGGQERRFLVTQLRRAELAKSVAVQDLEQASDTAARAGSLQLQAELILAYMASIRPGDTQLQAFDYEGREMVIPLRADWTPKENANALFQKAKRAKSAIGLVTEQLARKQEELVSIRSCLIILQDETDLAGLVFCRRTAEERGWLRLAAAQASKKPSERPFEGHPIRELATPDGWAILVGESTAANDYLTSRVAKTNDWWLHVRGGPSAHAIIRTMNQPDRVPQAAIRYAAWVVAKHSSSKHSSVVAVDYTLKKYVRKPKGSAPGLATYTHEKTIHVDPTQPIS